MYINNIVVQQHVSIRNPKKITPLCLPMQNLTLNTNVCAQVFVQKKFSCDFGPIIARPAQNQTH